MNANISLPCLLEAPFTPICFREDFQEMEWPKRKQCLVNTDSCRFYALPLSGVLLVMKQICFSFHLVTDLGWELNK